MYQLIFEPKRLSRKITKSEWLDIWRWKRNTEKEIRIQTQKQIDIFRESLINFGVYGQTVLDRIINPSVMIYPESNYNGL